MFATPTSFVSAIDASMKGLRDVHPGGMTLGANQCCELLGRVTEPAADVQNPVPTPGRMDLHRGVAVRLQSGDDEIPVLDEAIEENAAPCLGRLLVLGRDGGSRTR